MFRSSAPPSELEKAIGMFYFLSEFVIDNILEILTLVATNLFLL